MRRILLAVTLAAALAPTAGSTFGPVWSFFSSLWRGQATLDEGCGMDPSGRCHAAAQIQPDEGCGMDPNGRCQPGS